MAKKEYIEREAFIRKLEFAEKKEGELSAEYAKNQHLYSESVKYGHGEYCYLMARRMALEAPAADVVEVVHGEWVLKSEIHKMLDDVDEEFFVECPFCKRTFYVPFEFEEEKMLAYAKEKYPYCNCGAKMDGKGDE